MSNTKCGQQPASQDGICGDTRGGEGLLEGERKLLLPPSMEPTNASRQCLGVVFKAGSPDGVPTPLVSLLLSVGDRQLTLKRRREVDLAARGGEASKITRDESIIEDREEMVYECGGVTCVRERAIGVIDECGSRVLGCGCVCGGVSVRLWWFDGGTQS